MSYLAGPAAEWLAVNSLLQQCRGGQTEAQLANSKLIEENLHLAVLQFLQDVQPTNC